MQLHFTKMQGAGNDFVVLDCTAAPFALTRAQLRRIGDRRFGVGCDQFLIVEPASGAGVDFNYRIFNCDGDEVEACGNGARAFVRFVRAKGLTQKRDIVVDTQGGRLRLVENEAGGITVEMGIPKLAASQIPFQSDTPDAVVHALEVNGFTREITVVNMGNPHAVQIVGDVDTAQVTIEGSAIENHARFPKRVNAGFMQILNAHEIKLRVWERGAGETLACGTGACAAVVAGIARGVLQSPVRVHARGGDLDIEWPGKGSAVRMTGPAEIVFEGQLTL
jgi:diaminopimelate epimerase